MKKNKKLAEKVILSEKKTEQKNGKLKVAIVAELLVKMGGAERVVKKFAEMYPNAPIFTLLYDEEKCGKDFPASRIRTSFLQNFPRFLRKRYRWFLGLMPYAVESLDLSEFDLVISSSSAFAHGILTGSESVHICYCHSPMRYAWDYAHEYLKGKWFGPVKRWLASRTLEKIRIWDKISADRVDFYVANSEHVQRRIAKYYRLPSEIIYPPVDVERFVLGKERGDYFLIVSALTEFKKVDLAVSLFNKLGKKLVIIGDGMEREYLQSIAGKNIEFKGRLSDFECKKWLEGCRALIFPGEEDFGIAMIEAMACGKPVLAYGVGGALETVVPGVSGEFFYESTVEAMEDGLGRLIVNENKYEPAKIREGAMKFSEKRFESEWEYLVKEKLKKC